MFGGRKKKVVNSDSGSHLPLMDPEKSFSQDGNRSRSRSRIGSVKGSMVIAGNLTVEIDGLTEDHCLDLDQFISKYETDLHKGLTGTQVVNKRLVDGLNQLTPVKETPLWIQFLQELYRGFGLLLWAAAILCFISWEPLGDPPSVYNLALAIFLILVNVFQAVFSFVQHRYSSNIIATFMKIIPKKCKVLRDSSWQEIDVPQVVVGDVIKMTSGEQFPADMRIIECCQAKLEKASLTGESKPIALTTQATDKNPLESRNLAFFGTYLLEGTCTGIVTDIGDNTIMGRIAKLTAKSKQSLTSLQKEINYFVALIAIMSFVTAAILLLAWGFWLNNAYPTYINTSNMLVNCIGVIVAFIPEGLPISVTMTLTLVAKRMFKIRLMVKRLAVTETLGSSTVIASDKTGTITQNQMSLSQVWFPQDPTNFKPELDYINMLSSEVGPHHDQTLKILHLATLCNNAQPSNEAAETKSAMKFIGSSTDVGLMRGTARFLNIDQVKNNLPVVAELPFNSRYKCQLTIHQASNMTDFLEKNRWDIVLGKPNPGYLKILKGAPEIIIKYCSSVVLSNKVEELSPESTQKILDAAETLAKRGERVIGFAYEFLPPGDIGVSELDEETPHLKNFAFAGFASLIDPPKEGVLQAVDQCHTAGIRVIMVTGDHPTTAVAIARMVHIIEKEDVTVFDPATARMEMPTKDTEIRIQESDLKKSTFMSRIQKYFVTNPYSRAKEPAFDKAIVVVGKYIGSLDETSWTYILSHKEIVFARTTPEQKLKIVQALQRRGEVVAVTGDGVNDAPALKSSDIGVSMGSGSDVSKEAANVIALDDGFGTIVEGIKEGRLLYDNLQKVIAYLLPAGSFSEILPVIANIFLGMPLPLTAVQMIIICMGSDMIGSLGLVHELPEPGLMERQPRDPKNDRMINLKIVNYTYLQVGILESTIAFLMYFYTLNNYGVPPSGAVLAFSDWGNDGYLGLSADQQNDILAKAQTAFYVSLVMTQLWNLLCARTKRQSLFTVKFRTDLIYYMIGEVLVVCFVCYVPFMNTYLSTAPADWEHFLIPLGLGSVLLIVEETRKFFVRRNPKGFLAKIAW